MKPIESLHEKSEVVCSIAYDLQDAVEACEFGEDDAQEMHYAMFRNMFVEDIKSLVDDIRKFSNKFKGVEDAKVSALYIVCFQNIAQAEKLSKAIKKTLLDGIK